ncbi:cation transporter [Knoellia locipacati]|uniref:cation transporter n=1 Tax=Knoellia locipacati TaxID=882824 RepID=UPI001FEC31C0|nr:cation transporter [Knoellia locipacati]
MPLPAGSPEPPSSPPPPHRLLDAGPLRRVVLTVAALNFAWFWVEVAVALAIGSVALFADSVDFLEDTAINLLIALALGWGVRHRALAGKVMAGILLVPAAAAVWQAVQKWGDPVPPQVGWLVATAGSAALVNGLCAWLLARVRTDGGSLSRAAYLSARNDVLVNVAIIAMGVVTALTGSGWPDIVLGLGIVALGVHAAAEVWEVASEEHLAAKALAGEDID